jgi:Uncharacterized protein conserved in bacteria (DUF2252)
MDIVKATIKYEEWLGRQLRIVESDLHLKHDRMSQSRFAFFRATFYRWLQLWDDVCPDLRRAPRILSVGDLHVENFGTWRDTDGRLVWGVNDFDEASSYPYTMDLVRLATSALLAAKEDKLALNPKDSAESILAGYGRTMEQGGRPFVLEEQHGWLRAIAESKLRDPVLFWQKMDRLGAVRGAVPKSACKALEGMLPETGIPYKLVHRIAGLGSLGRVRIVALADWNGGRVAREAKALAPSAQEWADPSTSRKILYEAILRRAVRCPDPYVKLRGDWIVRRLSPHCSRIELEALGNNRGECRLLEAMGHETANIHVGTAEKQRAILKDLRKRKANWLIKAAESMSEIVDKDWLSWRASWRGRTS